MNQSSSWFLPFLLCLVLAVTLTSCRDGQNKGVAEPAETGSGDLTATAVQDLAKRLGVEPGEITVLRSVEVTWPDGSLGCPKEDMMYTQALVEGVLIVLRAGSREYEYHSGKGRPPFYCESPGKPLAKSPAE